MAVYAPLRADKLLPDHIAKLPGSGHDHASVPDFTDQDRTTFVATIGRNRY